MRTLPLLFATALVWAGDPPTPQAAPSTPPAAPNVTWLGVGLDEVPEALEYHLKLSNDLGVLITEVAPGSPAASAGVQRNDVVIAVDGTPCYTPRALRAAVLGHKPGEPIQLSVRRGADTSELTATLASRPAPPPDQRPMGHLPDMHDLLRRMHERHPRQGRVDQPDGSVLEWSIEDDQAGSGQQM